MASVKFDNYHAPKNDPSKTVSFDIHEIDRGIVNAVRRIILTDIPRIGFLGEEEPSLTILRNDGPLHNEILLHRFGLLPIHFTEEETESFEADEYEFELQVENKGVTMLNVTTGDFTVIKNGRRLTGQEVERLFPRDEVSKEHILITRLRTGEGLHVKGRPIVGTARKHAGFATGFCTFSYIQDPVLAAQASGVLEKERAFMRNEHGEAKSFRFHVEPYCGLSVRYMVNKAFEIIREKLQKTLTELYQEPSEYITTTTWKPDDNPNPHFGIEFNFKEEDDTFGNLLQSLLYNHYIREGKKTEFGRTVTYVGYVCPHPLERRMVLRIVFSEEAPLSEFIGMLAESCRRITAEIHGIETEWLRLKTE